MTRHPDTIGSIEWENKTYEIDWPHELENEERRDPYLAAVYLDGKMIGELPLPGFGQNFESKEQVMGIALEEITRGAFND